MLARALSSVIVLLLAGAIVVLPLDAVGLSDPVWLAGVYDGGDCDDLLAVAEEGATAPSLQRVRPAPGRASAIALGPIRIAGGLHLATAARAPPVGWPDPNDPSGGTHSLTWDPLGSRPLAPSPAYPIPFGHSLTWRLGRTSLVARPTSHRGRALRGEPENRNGRESDLQAFGF